MRRLSFVSLVLAALGGCGETDEDQAKTEEQSVVATQSDTDTPAWLSPTDAMDTGRWLASREAGRPLSNDDAASAQMRRSLGQAQSFFIEDPRMIANRTVQLGRMLSEAGKKETYEALLEGLTAVARSARGRQLFGEMCQHYFNTRRRGVDREASLAQLSERYGAQHTGEAKP
ncbi:hypothetical protein [Methylobacterium gnaphalii]|uniref:MxaH protein n=1 Tax=Methylobacterium gnaphalii TaxID=1010610 RepID=A0A512JK34_9HYPH|nr:hypothetical protein [Methylobacterium gnaphalii]GEP10325.1 hypothetical protein MGN01_21700 [Methylobacterium gnaphalii]GJD68485.1 hypothetical protein MMMDOFMJ_1408 [Methylobacterium gnaphalii]GLS51253.1 hypothetical protein GCM10007885_41080 [Methylobacterium gnaphalii]